MEGILNFHSVCTLTLFTDFQEFCIWGEPQPSHYISYEHVSTCGVTCYIYSFSKLFVNEQIYLFNPSMPAAGQLGMTTIVM